MNDKHLCPKCNRPPRHQQMSSSSLVSWEIAGRLVIGGLLVRFLSPYNSCWSVLEKDTDPQIILQQHDDPIHNSKLCKNYLKTKEDQCVLTNDLCALLHKKLFGTLSNPAGTIWVIRFYTSLWRCARDGDSTLRHELAQHVSCIHSDTRLKRFETGKLNVIHYFIILCNYTHLVQATTDN